MPVPDLPSQGAQLHVRLAVDEWGAWHNTQDPSMPPGYLYAYPNDALGFYGNNAGALGLTVTRTG